MLQQVCFKSSPSNICFTDIFGVHNFNSVVDLSSLEVMSEVIDNKKKKKISSKDIQEAIISIKDGGGLDLNGELHCNDVNLYLDHVPESNHHLLGITCDNVIHNQLKTQYYPCYK